MGFVQFSGKIDVILLSFLRGWACAVGLCAAKERQEADPARFGLGTWPQCWCGQLENPMVVTILAQRGDLSLGT